MTKEKCVIRAARLSDADRLDELLLLLIDDERRKYDASIGNIVLENFYQSKMIRGEGQIFVGELNEKIVGYIYILLEDQTHAKIDALYVLEEARNQHIATSLLVKAMNFLKEKGVLYIDISVLKENEIAKKLYSSFGFKFFKEILRLELK